MKETTINRLLCEYTTHRSAHICYLLTPIPVASSTIDRWAETYAVNMVVIRGMDWNADMTPWQAPNVKSKYPDFPGGGPSFMPRLAETMTLLEKQAGLSGPVERTLIGTSLSGLFGTWAWLTGSSFHNLICLSGSFWYPGFIQWLQHLDIPEKEGRAYFSLGDQEKHSRNMLFASIERCTKEVIPILQEAGNRLLFEMVPGAHHGGMVERIDRALRWMYATAAG